MALVLVVEDEQPIRDVVVLNLRADGHDVLEAANGDEALRHMRRGGLDVIVLDIMLPDVDGHALLAERCRLGLVPSARVVMLTACVDDRNHLRAFELGCDCYLTKPFSPDDLSATVARLLIASPEDLASHRRTELRKAEVLDQLERLMNHTGRH